MKSNDLVQAALKARLDAVEASFNALVEQEIQRGYSLAEVTAYDPDIIDAFAAKDRQTLLRRLRPGFLKLKKLHGVKQMQFHVPPATSFLRVHKPKKFNDDLSGFRKTVVDANKNHKPVLGTEIGVAGFGIRSVVPMAKDGKHLGTFEYGMAFGETHLKKLAAQMQMSIGLYVTKKGEFKLLSTTFPKSYQPSNELLTAAVGASQFAPQVSIKDNTFALRFIPVRDYSGNVAAVAVFGVDRAQFQAMLSSNLRYTGVISLLALVLLGGMAYAFMGNVISPINSLTVHMRNLANGDLSQHSTEITRNDEIGEMCRAVEVFRTNAVARARLEEEQAKEHEAGKIRQQHVEQLVGNFRNEAGAALESLSSHAHSLEDTAGRLTNLAKNSAERADTATTYSEDTSNDVVAVASAAEELSKSVSEIARQISKTSENIGQANERAASTTEKVSALSAAAQHIGDVVTLIEHIAGQTNLLALNATIEAARAGEAGRGFAVVASEVKGLAEQTAKATQAITAKIGEVQTSADESVSAINEIAAMISEVNSYTGAIAASVEEQGAATSEISSNVHHAADGTRNVTDNIMAVTSAVGDTSNSAQEVLQASELVNGSSRELKTRIEEFLAKVAAA
ncbi:MAG: cache domain-containing protein [Alphaproteobacteria bacterium]